MSITHNRDTTRRDGGSVDDRLARLLDTPFFARVVPHLAPETLHQLIQYRGLEACGELVASATPAQMNALLDLDLWRHAQPGRDDQFDVDRFGEWLDALADNGDSQAARIVAALDKALVVTGLSRYVRVFDPGTFEPVAQSDDEPIGRDEAMREGDDAPPDSPSAGFEREVGGYLVRAKRTDAWDAIVTLLTTLEAEHHADFHALMVGCRNLSNSRPEVDGLDDLLMAPEQHLHDVASDRERRRSQQGYATPADARAFLQMARQPQQRTAAPTASNPIAAAYFRAADEDADVSHHGAPDVDAGSDAGIPTSIDAVLELLVEAGVMPARPRALLAAAADDPRATKLPVLKRLLEFVLHADEAAYLTRSRELAFLANTLLAGASVQSRPFTSQEASDAAACICNLGLECWPARWPGASSPRGSSSRPLDAGMPPDAFLMDHTLVTAFEVGWSVLHHDVSLRVADHLVSTLADLHCVDADIRRDLRTLQRTLKKERKSGTPWLARDAAEVLAMLDTTASISVMGLLDECPIFPAALTAMLERRTTRVSPTAFEFISTTAQLDGIHRFLTSLPAVLSS